MQPSHSGLKSPHILELSGIGRKDVLTRAEIPMKLELPGVGENVQEHVFLGMSWGTSDCDMDEIILMCVFRHRVEGRRSIRDVGRTAKSFDSCKTYGAPVRIHVYICIHVIKRPASFSASSGLGLYTSGIVDFAFTTLDRITSKSDAIYQSMTEMLNNLDPETSPPGVSEQYKIMLERFEAGNGSPGCEFIGFPGLLSLPSESVKSENLV